MFDLDCACSSLASRTRTSTGEHVVDVAGDLHDLHRRDYLLLVKTYAQSTGSRVGSSGPGWRWTCSRVARAKDLLDAVVPDRIVLLPNRDGHSTWVNGRALELAGITRKTLDPADGRIERDANGEPAGTLHEGAADLVGRLAPEPTADEVYQGLLEGQRYLHSLGITAWQDAIVSTDFWMDNYSAYLRAAGNDDLTARVVGSLWWDRERGEDQIEDLLELRERGRAGRFAATTVKTCRTGMRDVHGRRIGALPGRTGALSPTSAGSRSSSPRR